MHIFGGTTEEPASPEEPARSRLDQSALGFGSDKSDYSELFTAFSCSDSDLSDFAASEGAPDRRTIEGSNRLYSNENPVYLLPLDEEEFLRLDKQNFILQLGMWGLFPLRNDIEDVIGKAGSAHGVSKRILDVGCGSGQWAHSMASTYSHVHVVAIDQAAQMPDEPLTNIEFHLHDVNQGLGPYYGDFDIVHVRCIGSGITSYRGLMEEASRCVRPGGLAIFIEGDFDLFKEDQHTIQEPATHDNPTASWLQKWMQSVREAQIRRCELTDADDSPETLDKGLWQFNVYDPAACGTASIFTPATPWPRSEMNEEALHFKVAGILMRQNLKLFVVATEQLLIEDGHLKDDVDKWMSRIREELEGEGLFKTWFRWRVAWGRMPYEHPVPSPEEIVSAIASSTTHPQVVPGERRQEARRQLLGKVPHFHLQQCHIRNRQESLAYVELRNNEPSSTRGRYY